MLRQIYIILAVILTYSCHKGRDVGPRPTNPSGNGRTPTKNQNPVFPNVWIVNEGTFLLGNASISEYDPNEKSIENGSFFDKNGYPLGDVAQSMAFHDGKGYIVVNNSQKIERVDRLTLEAEETITGFTSPRYFLGIHANKAYVSDFADDSIAIVNLKTANISGKIFTGGWTEEMVLWQDRVFITNYDRNNILAIDTSSDLVVDSILVGTGPVSLVVDKNDKLWVLCDGGVNIAIPELIRIDPATLSKELTLSFSSIDNMPSRLRINNGLDTLYYLNNDLYRLSLDANSLPPNPFIKSFDRTFYGLGIHPDNHHIYVSDAKDFVSKGDIYVYHPETGSRIDSVQAGVIPGYFVYY